MDYKVGDRIKYIGKDYFESGIFEGLCHFSNNIFIIISVDFYLKTKYGTKYDIRIRPEGNVNVEYTFHNTTINKEFVVENKQITIDTKEIEDLFNE